MDELKINDGCKMWIKELDLLKCQINHTRKFGAAGSFLSRLGSASAPAPFPPPRPPSGVGVRGGDSIVLAGSCPSARSLGHRDSASGSVQTMALLALAPSADSRRLLLFLCFLFSVSVHFKN